MKVRLMKIDLKKGLVAAFGIAALFAMPLSAASVRIYQTNSAGDDVDVIDPATNKVVMKIKDIEVPHGVSFAPDGSRAYITCEAESTVWAVDTKTGKVIAKVPLSGHPNNLSTSQDGKRVFVSIVAAPGAVDVIDTVALKNIKTIPIRGNAHNTYVTPDGKFVVAGSVAGKTVTVIDELTLEKLWDMDMSSGVRPIAFDKNPDGSTKNMYIQLSNFHGFAVVDFKTHKEIQRVTLPDKPQVGETHSAAPSHGIAVAPDGKSLWVNSSQANGVFAYSLPDLKYKGYIAAGPTPDWLTFTPDGKRLYVAVAGANYVSVLDTQAMKEVSRIPVGEVPKRNGTVMVP
jgi:YVTN family beta-propeller protein